MDIFEAPQHHDTLGALTDCSALSDQVDAMGNDAANWDGKPFAVGKGAD